MVFITRLVQKKLCCSPYKPFHHVKFCTFIDFGENMKFTQVHSGLEPGILQGRVTSCRFDVAMNDVPVVDVCENRQTRHL